MNEMRAMMAGLRPRLLEEKGLGPALEALAGMAPLWGPNVTVAVSGQSERMAEDVELALYRIAQEAITNARKHSAAREICVTLEICAESATLRVTDNGQGFPPRRLRPTAGHGEGVPGMRERAELLGGTLQIESAPGKGTQVLATLPLTEHDEG
jgi:signal transduction histidine kinase